MLRLGDEGYGAGLPDEPLLPWLQRYAKAVGDLQRSRSTTVVVTWQRSALELHLTRTGNTEVLLSLHGTSAFASANPLQQWWRDSQVAGRHAVADSLMNMEVYGGALLGTEPITPLI